MSRSHVSNSGDSQMDTSVQFESRIKAAQNKNLIGGQWLDAASGQTIEAENPATQELIAAVPRSAAEDIDRAVNTARASFELYAFLNHHPTHRTPPPHKH